MDTVWIKDLFGTLKPVIAMAHLPALPGTPRYDAAGGMLKIIDRVAADVAVLREAGVDGIMFCNEDDRPYVLEAGIEQIAAFTRVVAELSPKGLPFGVDFLWDPMAALAIAHATGASFVREVFTGVYESDMGLWSPNAGRAMRFRRQIGGENIRVFYNVVPEFSDSLGGRTMKERARSAVVSSLADLILVSGPMAGVEPNLGHIQAVKQAVPGVPVFLNTGAKISNISEYLSEVDGVIVGSSLKVEGITWNPVDPVRVQAFMNRVRQIRSELDEHRK